jgi:hypothetical protein
MSGGRYLPSDSRIVNIIFKEPEKVYAREDGVDGEMIMQDPFIINTAFTFRMTPESFVAALACGGGIIINAIRRDLINEDEYAVADEHKRELIHKRISMRIAAYISDRSVIDGFVFKIIELITDNRMIARTNPSGWNSIINS